MLTSNVNLEGTDEKSVMLQAWRRPGKTPTSMCLRMDLTFPLWDVDTLWNLVKDIEERLKWDKRAVDPMVLERFPEDRCKIFTLKTPKPPIPLVAQREAVLKQFSIENWKDGKHLNVVTSVEHPERPVG